MQIQELRAIKLQHLKADIMCLNARYRDLDTDSVAQVFSMRCKAQNIANTLLELEVLSECKAKEVE